MGRSFLRQRRLSDRILRSPQNRSDRLPAGCRGAAASSSSSIQRAARAREGVPRLRGREVFAAVRAALDASARANCRVVHYSVQGNHIHLVVESADKLALSRGMQGLAIRVARAVNRTADRTGRVFADHYFARELKTPAEVRRAVRYVLDNLLLHAVLRTPQTDACAASISAPRTWLLSVGWQGSRAGPLPVAFWALPVAGQGGVSG